MPDALNNHCHCISLDEAALVRQLDAAMEREGSLPHTLAGREHLFAHYPVFASVAQWDAMRAVVAAAHEVMALPAYRDDALCDTAWPDQHTLSAMMAFDFHPEPGGAKLIEINTNAGGAYLAALLGESQRACCAEVDAFLAAPASVMDAIPAWHDDFLNEWRLARPGLPLRRILIVDDAPEQQFLYPEFLLFRNLFRRHGIACEIADAARLSFDGNRLVHDGETIDLVYNRCTDFTLEDPAHAALRQAYLRDRVVLTPSPRHHALFADKRHLVRLSDQQYLESIGASAAAQRVLALHVPRARLVTQADADAIWATRKHYFFKPFAGFASRGAYRGESITRKVWSDILASGRYIAQQYAAPPTRRSRPGGDGAPLKFDLRCVSYGASIRLLSARVYQGQTTNLRTASGGLASVFVVRDPPPESGAAYLADGSTASPNQTTA